MDGELREWLARIETKVEELQKQFKNHLNHHFVFTMTLVTGLITLSGIFLMWLLKLL